MKIRTMVFVALLALSGQSVNAGYYTANEVLNKCEGKLLDDAANCAGFLVGVVDTQELFFD